MAEFNELIRNFNKIRDYMRDFYIYGFRSRTDFQYKSLRTYDNEKRRIESYMGEYMKWEYTKSGKNAFISMDCAKILVNPLYAAWKSKAFTSNDIMLHFYLLDILKEERLSINELTDKICQVSGRTFEVQTIRNKCKEYVEMGFIQEEKLGKAFYYGLSSCTFEQLLAIAPQLSEAVKFFQGSAALGEIGSFIMDNEKIENDRFSFKHYYVAHTLEDEVLLLILTAIRNKQLISFINEKEIGGWSVPMVGVPLKIFTSAATGRRYVCIYKEETRRFFNYRLDHIKSVKQLGVCETVDTYHAGLSRNLDKVWGVSFGGRSRSEIICMKLYVNEKTETHILERIAREGQGGEVTRLEENVFLYTKEIYDSNDMTPWIKTFMGRILQLEGSNQAVVKRFYYDIDKMKKMYED